MFEHVLKNPDSRPVGVHIGTIRDDTGLYANSSDHSRPFSTIPDHSGPFGTFRDDSGITAEWSRIFPKIYERSRIVSNSPVLYPWWSPNGPRDYSGLYGNNNLFNECEALKGKSSCSENSRSPIQYDVLDLIQIGIIIKHHVRIWRIINLGFP